MGSVGQQDCDGLTIKKINRHDSASRMRDAIFHARQGVANACESLKLTAIEPAD